jgi:predicted Zn-ribbon and HTH transcriptional regulator
LISMSKKKMTTKELTVQVEALTSAFNNLGAAIGADMAQVMAVISGLLKHFDLLAEVKCPHCGTELSYPNMDNVPPPTHCPACESELGLDEEE